MSAVNWVGLNINTLMNFVVTSVPGVSARPEQLDHVRVVQVPHQTVLRHQVREVRGGRGAGPEHLDSHLDIIMVTIIIIMVIIMVITLTQPWRPPMLRAVAAITRPNCPSPSSSPNTRSWRGYSNFLSI